MTYEHLLTEHERTHLTYLVGYCSGQLHAALTSPHSGEHTVLAVKTLLRLTGLQEDWLAKMAERAADLDA